mgnify:CR=1 FL=1
MTNPTVQEQIREVVDSFIIIDVKDDQIVREAKMQARRDATQAIIDIVDKEVIGDDDPGRRSIDLGSEFSTPRDYRRAGENALRESQREKLR